MKKAFGFFLVSIGGLLTLSLSFITLFAVIALGVSDKASNSERSFILILVLIIVIALIASIYGLKLAYGESPFETELTVNNLRPIKRPFNKTNSALTLDFGTFFHPIIYVPFFILGFTFISFFGNTLNYLDIGIGLLFGGFGFAILFVKKKFYWCKKQELWLLCADFFGRNLFSKIYLAPNIHQIYVDEERFIKRNIREISKFEIEFSSSQGYIELFMDKSETKVIHMVDKLNQYLES